MATDKNTVLALQRIVDLISELNSLKKVLSRHAGQQGRQIAWDNDGKYGKKIVSHFKKR